jgi:hypothetical protein
MQLTDEANADALLTLSRHSGIDLKLSTSYSKYKKTSQNNWLFISKLI